MTEHTVQWESATLTSYIFAGQHCDRMSISVERCNFHRRRIVVLIESSVEIELMQSGLVEHGIRLTSLIASDLMILVDKYRID